MKSKFLANLKISYFLAHKSIKRGDKGATLFTILIITLAFINLILFHSLLDGVIEGSELNVIDFRFGHVVIDPADGELYINDVNQLMKGIWAIPEVTGVAPHYKLGSSICYQDKAVVYPVYSMDPVEESMVTKIEDHLVEGSFLSKHDTKYILLGNELTGGYGAKFETISLGGVHAGDKVEVIYTNGVTKEYYVKGIFNTDDIICDVRAYVSQKEMENVLGINGKASEVIVRLNKIGIEKPFVKKLQELGIKEKVNIWEERAGIATNMIDSFAIVKSLLGSISLLVAAITIFIVIYITTMNKRKEIGVLKAIGIKSNVIIKSFLFQSMFYTICGCFLGYVVLMLFLKPYFNLNPLKFPMGWVRPTITHSTIFKSLISLITAALIGGIIPSWKVVREKILKLIWG